MSGGMSRAALKNKLEADGTLTNGVGRRVQAHGCKTCHAPLLAGYDADLAARVCYVDVQPLSAAGEALAVLTGRYTVGLWRSGDHYELQARDQWAIAGSPPPDRRFDVHAEHRCGAPPLPTLPSTHHRPRVTTPAAPPF